MKILLVDLISPKGHVNYDKGVLRCLQPLGDVDFCAYSKLCNSIPANYYTNLVPYPNELYVEDLSKSQNGLFFKISWRYNLIKFIKSVISRSSYDFVVFSSIEIISFSLATKLYKVSNVAFIDHGIGKIFESIVPYFFYKYVLDSQVKMLVMEDYIAEKIRNRHIFFNIFTVKHPLPIFSKANNKGCKSPAIVFAPSGNNSSGFIQQLIEESLNIPDGIKIIIKSIGQSYENEKLSVYNGELSQTDYENYIKNSSYILIPYESNYNYRISAIIFEAIQMRKKILLLNNNTLRYNALLYPGLFETFNDINGFLKINFNNRELDKKDFDRYIKDYSDEKIIEQLKKIIFT